MSVERPIREHQPHAEAAPATRYVAGCALLGAGLAVVAFAVGGLAIPHPLTFGVLTLVALGASRLQFSVSVRGIGGVVESITVAEIAAVLAIVFLTPGWAVVAVTLGALLVELLFQRGQPVVKSAYNVVAETISVAVAASVHLVVLGSAGLPAVRAVAATILAALVYIAVNTLVFTGLVSRLTGANVTDTLREHATSTGLAVSVGVAAAGVVGAVLVVVAPAALPLLVAPMMFDRVLAQRRRDRLALAAGNAAAEHASQAKSAFLTGLSHELRTPLDAVRNDGQRLARDPSLGQEQGEYAGLIVQSGQHLLRVVEDALDITRIEAGRLRLDQKPVDVIELIRQVLALLRPLADQRDIALRVETDGAGPPASADAHRLRQVLLNLAANAVKYNHVGGEVVVRVVGGPGDHPHLRIEVADNGPGIAAEDLSRLFVPFERLHAHSADVEGTGLGLSVSRHLVEAMGGRLTVASEPGVGATFTVTLPSAPRRTPPAPRPDR